MRRPSGMSLSLLARAMDHGWRVRTRDELASARSRAHGTRTAGDEWGDDATDGMGNGRGARWRAGGGARGAGAGERAGAARVLPERGGGAAARRLGEGEPPGRRERRRAAGLATHGARRRRAGSAAGGGGVPELLVGHRGAWAASERLVGGLVGDAAGVGWAAGAGGPGPPRRAQPARQQAWATFFVVLRDGTEREVGRLDSRSPEAALRVQGPGVALTGRRAVLCWDVARGAMVQMP